MFLVGRVDNHVLSVGRKLWTHKNFEKHAVHSLADRTVAAHSAAKIDLEHQASSQYRCAFSHGFHTTAPTITQVPVI